MDLGLDPLAQLKPEVEFDQGSARVLVEVGGGVSETLTVPRDALVARAVGSRRLWRVREDDGALKAYPVTVSVRQAIVEDNTRMLFGDA